MATWLVTGGTGFIGSALVRRLLTAGHRVRILDNNWRGRPRRLAGIENSVEMIVGDVRDPARVRSAVDGVDGVAHLSAVNGTRFFYEQPELVIDVAVRGILSVIDACRDAGVRQLVVASSSEAYQRAEIVPTPEDVPLVVPDVRNPRYSYGGSKLASELIAVNYGRRGFDRVVIFRPHNVYGSDMGFEHVIPELSLRAAELDCSTPKGKPLNLSIRGDGTQTRAFIHIDDFTEGLLRVVEDGKHAEIYHIGTEHAVPIRYLAELIVRSFGRTADLRYESAPIGETDRRCPDVAKLRALGWVPTRSLEHGLPPIVRWYAENAHLQTVA